MKKKANKWLASFLLILLILSLSQLGASLIGDFFRLVSQPIYRTFDYLGQRAKNFTDHFVAKKDILAENKALVNRNNLLLRQLVQSLEHRKERDALQEMMGLEFYNSSWKTVMGRVVYFNPAQDWLLLNLGKDDGVLVGQPVINSEYVLVGRVTEVMANRCQVSLVSSLNSLIKVRSLNEQGATGFIHGLGALKFNMEADIDQPFNAGDGLVTEVFQDEYPSNLPIGQIYKIEKNDLRSYLKAEINYFSDLDNLDILFVLKEF
jgi:rod shape-determining protein MreC